MVPAERDDACEVIRPEGDADRIQPPPNFQRRWNYRLLLTLAAIVVIAPVFIYALHEYQMRRMASTFLERAEKYEAEGSFALAAKNLQGYLRFNPDDIDARVRMALLTLETAETPGQKQNAYFQLSAVLTKLPERDDLRRKRVELLIDSLPSSAENLPQADQDLDILIGNLHETTSDAPDFARAQKEIVELCVIKAKCCEILSDTEGAIRAYRYAVKIDPEQVTARSHLARLLSRQGQKKEAEDVLKKLVQYRPDSGEGYRARASFYHDAGNLQAAIRDARTAYEKSPDDPRVLLLAAALISAEARSRGEIRSFDVQTVREQLEQALKKLDDAPRPEKSTPISSFLDNDIEQQRAIMIETLANLDLVADQPEAAIGRLTEAIAETPDNVEFRWSLANVLIGQGRVGEAQAYLDEIDDQDVAGPLKGFLQARILETQGEWLAAIETCEKISANRVLQDMFPGGTDLVRARCENQLGHTRRELIAYQRAVEADSGSAAARIGLASVLLRLGRVEEAQSALQEVETMTGVPLVLAQIDMQKNLRLAPNQRDWNHTQHLLDIAANQGEDIVDVQLFRAQIDVHRGDHDAARLVLLQAQRRSPDRIEPWIALAELEAQAGHLDKALQMLEEAENKLGWNFRNTQAQLNILAATDPKKARQVLSQLTTQAAESVPRATMLEYMAVMYERLGDIDKALANWEQISQLEPANFRAYMAQFELALEAQDFDRLKGADGILAKMAALEGEDGQQVRLARAHMLIAEARRGDRQRLDEARQILNELKNSFVLTHEVLASLGDWESVDGNQAAATDYYRDAILQGSDDPRVLRNLVSRLNSDSRFTEASAVIERFRQNTRRPLTNELRHMATYTLMSAGEHEQALQAAMESISPDSTNHQEHLWFAHFLIAANKMEEAEISLQSALTHGPEHVETWVAWLQFLKRVGRDEEIAQTIEKAKKQFPGDDHALEMAQIFEAVGDFDAAEKDFQTAVARTPNDTALRIAVAEFFNRIGRPQSAEPHLRRVLAEDSTASPAQQADARRALALALAADPSYPKFQAALQLLDENLDHNRWSLPDQRLKAFLLARQPTRKSRRQALQIYRQLQEAGSLLRQDRMVMVKLLVATDDWPQAKPLLREVLNDPQCTPADLAFGIRAMLNHGESEGVDDWIKRLAAAEPRELQTLGLQARRMIDQRREDEAIALLEAAMQPTDDQPAIATKAEIAVIYHSFAEMLDRTGRTVSFDKFANKSEAYLRETINEYPQQVLLLAGLLKLRGQNEEALKLLDESWDVTRPEQIAAASLDLLKQVPNADQWIAKLRKQLEAEIEKTPPSSELLFQAANLAHLQHDYDAAIGWYRKSLEKSPTSVVILNELAVLLALNDRDLNEALELINRAISLTGPNPMLLDTRATIHLAMNRPDLAIEDLKLALEDEASPTKYYHLAQARDLAGDRGAAQTAFQQALAAGFTTSHLHPLELESYQILKRKLQ